MASHAHRGHDDLKLRQFYWMPGIGKEEENGSPGPYRNTGWGALQRYRLGSPAEIQAEEIQKGNGEMVPSGRNNFKI